MKSKTVETAPFEYTYYLVHRETKKKDGPFKSIDEVKDFKRDKYRYSGGYAETMKIGGVHVRHEVEYRTTFVGGVRKFEYELRNPYCIVNHLGDVISLNEIKASSGGNYIHKSNDWWYNRHNRYQSNLIKRKGDGNKIKVYWSYRKCWSTWRNEEVYESAIYGRTSIQVQNERRANEACTNEYGEEFVRGKRRGRNLPCSWDAHKEGTYHRGKCWKHNSKRRKQWKPK